MTAVDPQIRDRCEWQISDPDDILAILHSRSVATASMGPYLDALRDRYGLDLPHLRTFSEAGILFQSGRDHLSNKRVLARLLSARALDTFRPVIDEGVSETLDRLRPLHQADLFSEFAESAPLLFLRRLIGLPAGDDGEIIQLIRTAHIVAHPRLSVAKMKGIEAAVARLDACLAAPGEDEGTLVGHLRRVVGQDDRARGLAWLALIASHALSQTLSRTIFGLLVQDLDGWRALGESGVTDADLDQHLSRYASTRVLMRVMTADAQVGVCPARAGDTMVLDIPAGNAALRDRGADRGFLSFGAGLHKCPGESLARAFAQRALPALARAFPNAALHRDGVRHFASPLLYYPNALPTELHGYNRRNSSRMFEVLQEHTARAIVNDDKSWGPPPLDVHLSAVQERTGTDLGPAIRIARNAMFFMSGPRHAAVRREVAAVLGGNRIAAWQPLIDRTVAGALDTVDASASPDLIRDFADPIFRGVMQPMLGVIPSEPTQFDADAPILQDVLEPWLPMRALLELQRVFDRLLNQMQTPPTSTQGPTPLLAHLLACDLDDFEPADHRALVLVLYGASFNLVHTLGNVIHQLLVVPGARPCIAREPQALAAQVDQLLASCASPKYIYRVARQDSTIERESLRKGDTVRLQLLSINRGAGVGHLGFGHGLHRCVGAAATRHILRAALPALFDRFPEIDLVPGAEVYHPMSQTIAHSHLPCRLNP